MNTKYFISFIILGSGIIISGVLLSNVLAQTASDIQYPVKELGNCQNEAACRTYCDKPENIKACVNFAEKNNLMSQEELQQAKKFVAAGTKGPGGCTGKDNCEEYCNDISHMDECISFAEKNNLMSTSELAEAQKIQAAIKRGIKPPPCGNKKQCDVYCNEADHMGECITFGMEAGFIQGKELEDAQKMLAAIKKGVKPPPCNGKEACDEYCQNPDNMEVCMNFAIEAGFMNDQEKQDSQKMLQALKKGIKPPACNGKEECDVYCAEESHFEECTKFAEAAGFMTPEEAAMARKTGGKGPGGCKGKEECEAFCNNPANQETCFNFAKENGMIPEADLRQMEEGKQKFQESLNQAPPEVISCLESLVGSEMMEKFRNGTTMPSQEIGDKMRECFEKTMGSPPKGGMPLGQPGMIMQGPASGCKSPEECKAYCETHPEECRNFQAPIGGPEGGVPGTTPGTMPAGPMTPNILQGPGGCKSEEECRTYCQSHPEECRGAGQMPMGPAQMGPQMPTGEFVKPPEGFQPPPEQTQPMMAPPMQPDQQMPMEQIMPIQPEGQLVPPPPTESPPPSSAISPEFLLGLIFGILNSGSNH